MDRADEAIKQILETDDDSSEMKDVSAATPFAVGDIVDHAHMITPWEVTDVIHQPNGSLRYAISNPQKTQEVRPIVGTLLVPATPDRIAMFHDLRSKRIVRESDDDGSEMKDVSSVSRFGIGDIVKHTERTDLGHSVFEIKWLMGNGGYGGYMLGSPLVPLALYASDSELRPATPEEAELYRKERAQHVATEESLTQESTDDIADPKDLHFPETPEHIRTAIEDCIDELKWNPMVDVFKSVLKMLDEPGEGDAKNMLHYAKTVWVPLLHRGGWITQAEGLVEACVFLVNRNTGEAVPDQPLPESEDGGDMKDLQPGFALIPGEKRTTRSHIYGEYIQQFYSVENALGLCIGGVIEHFVPSRHKFFWYAKSHGKDIGGWSKSAKKALAAVVQTHKRGGDIKESKDDTDWKDVVADPRIERWIFTGYELKHPEECKRTDIFLAAVYNLAGEALEHGVQVTRTGNATDMWSDGTRGVQPEVKDEVEQVEAYDKPWWVNHAANDDFTAEEWRDVYVSEDGRFVGFVDQPGPAQESADDAYDAKDLQPEYALCSEEREGDKDSYPLRVVLMQRGNGIGTWCVRTNIIRGPSDIDIFEKGAFASYSDALNKFNEVCREHGINPENSKHIQESDDAYDWKDVVPPAELELQSPLSKKPGYENAWVSLTKKSGKWEVMGIRTEHAAPTVRVDRRDWHVHATYSEAYAKYAKCCEEYGIDPKASDEFYVEESRAAQAVTALLESDDAYDHKDLVPNEVPMHSEIAPEDHWSKGEEGYRWCLVLVKWAGEWGSCKEFLPTEAGKDSFREYFHGPHPYPEAYERFMKRCADYNLRAFVPESTQDDTDWKDLVPQVSALVSPAAVSTLTNWRVVLKRSIVKTDWLVCRFRQYGSDFLGGTIYTSYEKALSEYAELCRRFGVDAAKSTQFDSEISNEELLAAIRRMPGMEESKAERAVAELLESDDDTDLKDILSGADTNLGLKSDTIPGIDGHGYRVVLHFYAGGWCVGAENLNPDQRSVAENRYYGNYAEAYEEFLARCNRYGVSPNLAEPFDGKLWESDDWKDVMPQHLDRPMPYIKVPNGIIFRTAGSGEGSPGLIKTDNKCRRVADVQSGESRLYLSISNDFCWCFPPDWTDEQINDFSQRIHSRVSHGIGESDDDAYTWKGNKLFVGHNEGGLVIQWALQNGVMTQGDGLFLVDIERDGEILESAEDDGANWKDVVADPVDLVAVLERNGFIPGLSPNEWLKSSRMRHNVLAWVNLSDPQAPSIRFCSAKNAWKDRIMLVRPEKLLDKLKRLGFIDESRAEQVVTALLETDDDWSWKDLVDPGESEKIEAELNASDFKVANKHTNDFKLPGYRWSHTHWRTEYAGPLTSRPKVAAKANEILAQLRKHNPTAWWQFCDHKSLGVIFSATHDIDHDPIEEATDDTDWKDVVADPKTETWWFTDFEVGAPYQCEAKDLFYAPFGPRTITNTSPFLGAMVCRDGTPTGTYVDGAKASEEDIAYALAEKSYIKRNPWPRSNEEADDHIASHRLEVYTENGHFKGWADPASAERIQKEIEQQEPDIPVDADDMMNEGAGDEYDHKDLVPESLPGQIESMIVEAGFAIKDRSEFPAFSKGRHHWTYHWTVTYPKDALPYGVSIVADKLKAEAQRLGVRLRYSTLGEMVLFSMSTNLEIREAMDDDTDWSWKDLVPDDLSRIKQIITGAGFDAELVHVYPNIDTGDQYIFVGKIKDENYDVKADYLIDLVNSSFGPQFDMSWRTANKPGHVLFFLYRRPIREAIEDDTDWKDVVDLTSPHYEIEAIVHEYGLRIMSHYERRADYSPQFCLVLEDRNPTTPEAFQKKLQAALAGIKEKTGISMELGANSSKTQATLYHNGVRSMVL